MEQQFLTGVSIIKKPCKNIKDTYSMILNIFKYGLRGFGLGSNSKSN